MGLINQQSVKYAGIAALFAMLLGCEPPKEHGQQYIDGVLYDTFTQADHIGTQVARDYRAFHQQANIALANSSKLRATYGELYDSLSQWAMTSGDPTNLHQYGIQAAQLQGSDHQGNVFFTGYYSPVIELRHQPDEEFKYPLYTKPDCKGKDECPTRQQIDEGALNGLNLELGYARSIIEPFMMGVQGSGFVHFGDSDSMQYFAYAGQNGHPYRAIGKDLIQQGLVPRSEMSLKAIVDWANRSDVEAVKKILMLNQSYVFFEAREKNDVIGAAGVPLLPMVSVAGDRRNFPMGTPILAEVPLLDAKGQWTGTYVLRLLLVLDVGGAVKGNHFDIYHGIGEHLGYSAGHYQHYGRVWKLGKQGTITESPWISPNNRAKIEKKYRSQ